MVSNHAATLAGWKVHCESHAQSTLLEDLKKAAWYLNRQIELLENENNPKDKTMNNIKFPSINLTPIKCTTFFYGVCTDDRLIEVIKDAEANGCELVQVVPGLMNPPNSALALPGTKQGPIPVLKILVRCTDENYAALVAKRNQANVSNPGVN